MADTLARSSTAPAALHSRPANNGIKVLVLGGTQFIGRTTVATLVDQHFSVTILNRGQTPIPFGTVVDHIPCDRVGEPEKFAGIVADPKWDAIVDFIAFEPKDVKPILAAKPRTYVFISTDSIYMACNPASFVRAESGGMLEGSDVETDAARAADDEYGSNKLATERALKAAVESADGSLSSSRVIALRLPDVIGPYENTERLQLLCLALLKGKKVGTSVCEMSGRELPLGIVAAADVASAIVALLEQQSPSQASSSSSSTPQQGSFTALHIASDERPTWCDLVRMFAHELRVSGMQVPNVRFTDNKDSGFVSVDCGALDTAAARALIGSGWTPAPLKQRVRESVQWWLSCMRAAFQLRNQQWLNLMAQRVVQPGE